MNCLKVKNSGTRKVNARNECREEKEQKQQTFITFPAENFLNVKQIQTKKYKQGVDVPEIMFGDKRRKYVMYNV